jgi:hypothetical protein
MRQIGRGSYGKRVSRAAETLLEHQGFDGGWGLTLTSVSSIVNTCEALAGAVEDHCRPRQKGGRGENTRFACFALNGLLGYPQFFTQPGIADAAAWCVDWLEQHQVDQGWPEVAGVDDVSLHQTARAVLALSELRSALAGLGPGFVLRGGTDISVLLDRVGPLITHGVRGLLYHRRSSGAWGWRTYVDTTPSPSKTALCLMAVAGSAGHLAVGDPFDAARDQPVEAGGRQRGDRDAASGPIQEDDSSDPGAGEPEFAIHGGPRREQVIVNDEPVSHQRHAARVIEVRVLSAQRPGDVRAGEHHLARTPATADTEVAFDLGKRCAQSREPRAFQVEVSRPGTRQVDGRIELAMPEQYWPVDPRVAEGERPGDPRALQPDGGNSSWLARHRAQQQRGDHLGPDGARPVRGTAQDHSLSARERLPQRAFRLA